MPGIDGPALLIIILFAVGTWAAEGIAKGTKAVAHKTKCGVMRVVGKHCEPPTPATPAPPAAEGPTEEP